MTCQNGDALGVVDMGKDAGGTKWSVPGKPTAISVSPCGWVYTVSFDSKTVRRFSRDDSVPAQGNLRSGQVGLVLGEARGPVFLSDWYDARLFVPCAGTLTLLHMPRAGAAPAGLALSDNGRYLAVAERYADPVSLFDAATLEPLRWVKVGTRPFGLRFASDGRLFVADVGTDDASFVNPDKGAVNVPVRVGMRPYGMAFVTNQYTGTFRTMALDTLETTGTIEVGECPEGMDHASDGTGILFSNWFDNSVTVIDAQTLEPTETIEACDGPRAFSEFVLGEAL